MLAFCDPGEVREVDVPNEELANASLDEHLERIFYWGQNDFQPKQCPSVSCGDVIELNDEHWLVRPVGFHRLSNAEYQLYLSLERRDRLFYDPNGHDGEVDIGGSD
jgi:hypothetical protein